MSEHEPNAFAPDMAVLLEKLTRAGWITGSYVNPSKIAVNWTEDGRKKAKLLSDLIYEMDAISTGERFCLEYLVQVSRGLGGKR